MGKKEKHCDPADPDESPSGGSNAKQGDNWDHVALDPEHRLVVSVVPGKRTVKNVEALIQDFKERTKGRLMNLITSDEYKPYRQVILKAYGEETVPQRTGKPGRPKAPYYEPSPELKYATVHKTREKGRVVKIDFRVVFGCAGGHPIGGRLEQSPSEWAGGAEVVEGEQQDQHGVRGAASTGPTAAVTAGRPARPTASPRTGICMRRSPTSRCTATISAGRCGRCVNKVRMANGCRKLPPWPPA